MCRSDSTFKQLTRDDGKNSKHLLQSMLANCCSCSDHCKLRCSPQSTAEIPHEVSPLSFKRSILSQVILIFSIIQFKPARYEEYVFPPWAQGVGWLIALASIIWIPLGAVHTMWVLPGSFMQVKCIYHPPLYR